MGSRALICGIVLVMVCGMVLITSSSIHARSTDLLVEPETVDFGIVRGRELKSRTLLLTRSHGVDPLRWWITEGNGNGLDISPGSGILGAEPVSIILTLDPLDLKPGRYDTRLIIASSAGIQTVPVSFTLLAWRSAPPPILEELIITGGTEAIPAGGKKRFQARGVYADGSVRDLSDQVSWRSGNTRIAAFERGGLLSARTEGDTFIIAEKSQVRSPVVIIRVDATEGPVLAVPSTEISVGRVPSGMLRDEFISIRNSKDGELEWKVTASGGWIRFAKPGAPVRATVEPESGWGLQEGGPGGDEAGLQVLAGKGPARVPVFIDTTGLPAGTYHERLYIESNGGDEAVDISMEVVTLKEILLSPVNVFMNKGDTMDFRVTGIWSDGRRSDLSTSRDGNWLVSDAAKGSFTAGRARFAAKEEGHAAVSRMIGGSRSNEVHIDIQDVPLSPVLKVTPHEVGLGKIGPGESGRGVFLLSNVGTGTLEWSAGFKDVPEGEERRSLNGAVTRHRRYLNIYARSLIDDGSDAPLLRKTYPVQLVVESDTGRIYHRRDLPQGRYREELPIEYNGGARTLFVAYEVTGKRTRPELYVEPHGLDFGVLGTGTRSVKKVTIENRGKNVLAWNTIAQKNRTSFRNFPLTRGRYYSFLNETDPGTTSYIVPEHIKGKLFLSGEWGQHDGYPLSTANRDTLRFTFSGTGVALYLWKDSNGGIVNIFMDGEARQEIDCASFKRERIVVPIDEELDAGLHILTLTVRKGVAEIEGVTVYGGEIKRGRGQWLQIFPDRGTTTNETDYVNVTVDTGGLPAGQYAENIIFYTDETSEIVQVALDIMEGNPSDMIDIYSYQTAGSVLLSTRTEGAEQPVSFRLFQKGSPGTTEFFRWFNPQLKDYYYSYETEVEKTDLEGYVLEGPVGSIATIPLPGTKELYRWYNVNTGRHYFTTDPAGEGYQNRGYRYDGIAGYVK
ncbi:MAG: hypothetical protein JXO48_01745 [Deltaproteobacteria bacterium]|nr:hypothetical protein [Deltaproteobacteria bacterium]